MSTLFTIILPAYNAEKTISKCIDSVLNQTFTNYELIIVNDGSTDTTGSICDCYKSDSRVKVIHTLNGGVSRARNLALRHALGQWICFIDADDYVLPQHLSDYLALIETHGNNKLLFQGYWLQKGQSPLVKIGPDSTIQDANVAKTFVDIHFKTPLFGYAWSKIFCREKLIENGITFQEDRQLWEDLLFTLDYLMTCDGIIIGQAANYVYKFDTPGSLRTRKYSYQQTRSLHREVNRKIARIRNIESYQNEFKAIRMVNAYNGVMHLLYEKGTFTIADKCRLLNAYRNDAIGSILRIRFNTLKSYMLYYSLIILPSSLTLYLFKKIRN
ncbi:MAG: glycosyltransferase family 2 protein [Marinifilaceae bacterium]